MSSMIKKSLFNNSQIVSVRLEELERENIRLKIKNKSLEKRLAEVTFLHDVLTDLIKTGDFQGTTEAILEMAVKITKSEAGYVVMGSRKDDSLRIVSCWGECRPTVKDWLTENSELYHKCLDTSMYILTQEENSFQPLKRLDSLLRSLIAVPMNVDNKHLGILVLMHRHKDQDRHCFDYNENDRSTVVDFAKQAALILDNTQLKIEYGRQDIFLKTLSVLTSAIDAKDSYTRYHSRNVGMFAVALARGLGLTEEEVTSIHYGAILHDIGKIGIPETILNKPSKLSDSEIQIIKTHPMIGANMLSPIDSLGEAIHIVRYHHERFDGRGYPDGLKGEAIPYTARIVCIADAWDAMTSHRSYRQALPVEIAARELEEGAGSQFDSAMVKIFLNLIHKKTDLGDYEYLFS